MDEIKVETGIPLSAKNNPAQWAPWGRFNVGDSAFFAGGKSQRLSNASNAWGRTQTPRRKFATRSVNEDGVKGVRVWRVE